MSGAERWAEREQISGNNNQKEKILVEKGISHFGAHLRSHLGSFSAEGEKESISMKRISTTKSKFLILCSGTQKHCAGSSRKQAAIKLEF